MQYILVVGSDKGRLKKMSKVMPNTVKSYHFIIINCNADLLVGRLPGRILLSVDSSLYGDR